MLPARKTTRATFSLSHPLNSTGYISPSFYYGGCSSVKQIPFRKNKHAFLDPPRGLFFARRALRETRKYPRSLAVAWLSFLRAQGPSTYVACKTRKGTLSGAIARVGLLVFPILDPGLRYLRR